MEQRRVWNITAAAKLFAGFFAAILFVCFYYYVMRNRKPGMACS